MQTHTLRTQDSGPRGYLLGCPRQAPDIIAGSRVVPNICILSFLKALDEKRSNPWYYRCQSFTEKKIGLKGTSPLINPNTFTFSMSEIVDF